MERGSIITHKYRKGFIGVALGATPSSVTFVTINVGQNPSAYPPVKTTDMYNGGAIFTILKLGALSKIDLLDKAYNDSWLKEMREQIATDLGKELNLELEEKIPVYEFETYVRPFDNEIVEAKTGIPAKEYAKINLGKKIRDDL